MVLKKKIRKDGRTGVCWQGYEEYEEQGGVEDFRFLLDGFYYSFGSMRVHYSYPQDVNNVK